LEKRGTSKLHPSARVLESSVRTVWQATRRDADISQEALARKLGWSRGTVASVEGVRISDVILFATALEVEPETICRRIPHWSRDT
jgi:hypothetical protein